jgi:hypothetical protein
MAEFETFSTLVRTDRPTFDPGLLSDTGRSVLLRAGVRARKRR